MARRNPDIDLQQARRMAVVNGGHDMQQYFAMLWRIHPNRARDEVYRLEKQSASAFEPYLDFLIQLGELEVGQRQAALSYMRQQQFAWIFDPTPIDQVREAYPNHEDLCHGDDYPGHCCLDNLRETYDRERQEYVITCRHCEDPALGGYPESQQDSSLWGLEWVDGSAYSLPCAIPPYDPADDYY